MNDKFKDVIITIRGEQYPVQDDEDVTELVTDGLYCFKNGSGRISYMESAVTGLEDTRTTFLIAPDEVAIEREGMLTSRMVFHVGRRESALYDTAYGSMTMTIDTHALKCELDENGGRLELDYVVNFDHMLAGRNKVKISVKPRFTGGNSIGKSC